jgi:hypothetical protein
MIFSEFFKMRQNRWEQIFQWTSNFVTLLSAIFFFTGPVDSSAQPRIRPTGPISFGRLRPLDASRCRLRPPWPLFHSSLCRLPPKPWSCLASTLWPYKSHREHPHSSPHPSRLQSPLLTPRIIYPSEHHQPPLWHPMSLIRMINLITCLEGNTSC